MPGKNNAEWRKLSCDELRRLPSTRAESVNKDVKYYFTGKKCKKGHLSARYSMSTSCVICHAEREKARKQKPKSTFIRKETTQPIIFMGIKVIRSLSDKTD